MFCKECGKKSEVNQKFCIKCGTPFSNANTNREKKASAKQASSFSVGDRFLSTNTIIWILVIIAIVGFGIYGSLDEEAIEINEEAISSFDAGDNELAINQLKRATQEAITNDVKLQTLKNLAYVYSTELQNDLALSTFQEALTYTSINSFDYYLISGEIAVLEGKPVSAKLSYDKAHQKEPNNFQINNALNLFYLDIEEIAPGYIDYPKALSYAQKAYDLSDLGVKNIAIENLAIAHFFNENYDQTISLMLPYDLNQRPYFAYWIGWSYIGKDDISNAKIYFQKAVDGGAEGMEQEVYDYLNLY